MTKHLLEVSFKISQDGSIEEGAGMEKIEYPNVDCWILESFKDELKTAVLSKGRAGDEITIKVIKKGVRTDGK